MRRRNINVPSQRKQATGMTSSFVMDDSGTFLFLFFCSPQLIACTASISESHLGAYYSLQLCLSGQPVPSAQGTIFPYLTYSLDQVGGFVWYGMFEVPSSCIHKSLMLSSTSSWEHSAAFLFCLPCNPILPAMYPSSSERWLRHRGWLACHALWTQGCVRYKG